MTFSNVSNLSGTASSVARTRRKPSNLVPQKLRETMKERIEYDPKIEKDMNTFVKELCAEAKACQKYGQNRPTTAPRERNKESGSPSSNDSSSSTPREANAPVCPYPPHKAKVLRHRIMDCRNFPGDEKKISSTLTAKR